jgi:ferric-dicitrate binding protein FerR (iron transport regulator)
MKDKEYIESLIAGYLNGECLREDCEELIAWIEASSANKNEYLQIKDIWDSLNNQNDNTTQQLALFYKNQYSKSKTRHLVWIRSLSAVAAVLLLGLIFSVLVPYNREPQTDTLQVFSVPLGSRSKVILADGSEVSLNSGSELKYSAGFSSKNRVVSLTGEAFFNVKADPKNPFTVKTTDFDIKVTGTKFNVCSYSDNKYATATLAEGKIALHLNRNSDILKVEPGEKFRFDRKTEEHSLLEADVESEIAWKDDQFIFKNIPFPELAKRLERWYDVKLNYSDQKLWDYAFTGKFKNQETIWQVLDALKLTTPIDYQKTTFREYTITYKPFKNN